VSRLIKGGELVDIGSGSEEKGLISGSVLILNVLILNDKFLV
jgi:hypothetical protein